MSDDTEQDKEVAAAELDLSPSWGIATMTDADWALSRVADLKAEAEELEALYSAAVERAKLRRDQLLGRISRGVRFFENHLRLYAETHKSELLKGGKAKSRDLMNGRLGWKKSGGRLTIVDPEACLEWCRKQPVESGALRIKEEPALAELQKAFRATGVIPDGCDVSPEVEEFHVSTNKGVSNGEH